MAGPLGNGASNIREPAQVGLFEGNADPLILTPDNATRNARAVRLKEKVETLGGVLGIGDLQRGSRNRHVAD
jgi:hypothetical protein